MQKPVRSSVSAWPWRGKRLNYHYERNLRLLYWFCTYRWRAFRRRTQPAHVVSLMCYKMWIFIILNLNMKTGVENIPNDLQRDLKKLIALKRIEVFAYSFIFFDLGLAITLSVLYECLSSPFEYDLKGFSVWLGMIGLVLCILYSFHIKQKRRRFRRNYL